MCDKARIDGDLYSLACMPPKARKRVKPLYDQTSNFHGASLEVYNALMGVIKEGEISKSAKARLDDVRRSISDELRRDDS